MRLSVLFVVGCVFFSEAEAKAISSAPKGHVFEEWKTRHAVQSKRMAASAKGRATLARMKKHMDLGAKRLQKKGTLKKRAKHGHTKHAKGPFSSKNEKRAKHGHTKHGHKKHGIFNFENWKKTHAAQFKKMSGTTKGKAKLAILAKRSAHEMKKYNAGKKMTFEHWKKAHQLVVARLSKTAKGKAQLAVIQKKMAGAGSASKHVATKSKSEIADGIASMKAARARAKAARAAKKSPKGKGFKGIKDRIKAAKAQQLKMREEAAAARKKWEATHKGESLGGPKMAAQMKSFLAAQHAKEHELAIERMRLRRMAVENTRLKKEEKQADKYAGKMREVAEDKYFYKTVMVIVCAFVLLALPLMAFLLRAKKVEENKLETNSYSKKDKSIEMQSTKSLVDGDDAEMDLDEVEDEVVHAPAVAPSNINAADF
jgi:hypothetical protein